MSKELLNTIECFDPVLGEWKIVGTMASPRSKVSAVKLGRKIYILGGFNGEDRLNSVECFEVGQTRLIREDVPEMLRKAYETEIVLKL